MSGDPLRYSDPHLDAQSHFDAEGDFQNLREKWLEDHRDEAISVLQMVAEIQAEYSSAFDGEVIEGPWEWEELFRIRKGEISK